MFNIKRAIIEIKSCVNAQWSNGMLPHIRFIEGEDGYSPGAKEWAIPDKEIAKFQTSGITQPPILSISLEKIIKFKNYNAIFDVDVLYIAEKLDKFHTFLFKYRDPFNEDLITLIHPWESGLDNLPIFDELNEYAKESLNILKVEQQIKKRKDIDNVNASFRPDNKDYELYGKLIGFFKLYNYDQTALAINSPFRVQDLLFNILFYKALISLSNVFLYLNNRKPNKSLIALSKKNYNNAIRVKKSILEKLYSKKRNSFYSYDLVHKKLLEIDTIESLIASIYFLDKKVETIIENYQSNDALCFLSTSNNESSFNPIKYWRGPVWPVTNWFIIDAIKQTNQKLAKVYAKHTLEIISEGYNHHLTYKLAKQLMLHNLVFDQFTTPSKSQYKHGWLWDSGFAAIGWLHVEKSYSPRVYDKIYNYNLEKNFLEDKLGVFEIRKIFDVPLFYEYYVGVDYGSFKKSSPLGSYLMTWTAAVYLDLYNFYYL